MVAPPRLRYDSGSRGGREFPGTTMSTFDRILGLVGRDDPETLAAKVTAVRRFLLVYLAVEAWFRYTAQTSHRSAGLTFALLFTLCMALGVFRRWNRSACEVATLVVLGHIAWTFPHTPDWMYVQGLVLLIILPFDPAQEQENALLLQGLRWVPLLVLLWSGIKKLSYGYWFGATFFGQMIGFDTRFKQAFALLLTPEEHLRLVRLFWPGALDRGPWTVDSPLVVALSNTIWILQIVVPLALLLPRLRRYAMALGILLVIAFELIAREVFFGALLSYLLLLYSPRDLNRKLFPVYCVLFAWLLLIAVGVLPRWEIT